MSTDMNDLTSWWYDWGALVFMAVALIGAAIVFYDANRRLNPALGWRLGSALPALFVAPSLSLKYSIEGSVDTMAPDSSVADLVDPFFLLGVSAALLSLAVTISYFRTAGAARSALAPAQRAGGGVSQPVRPSPADVQLPSWFLPASLAAVLAAVLILYDAAANEGDLRKSVFGGDDEGGTVYSSSPTPTTEPGATSPPATITPAPTTTASPAPSATPTIEPTATEPPLIGYTTPDEAIAAYFSDLGEGYAGDCRTADLDTDIGKYCSMAWEVRTDAVIYAVGLTFSEADAWLLVESIPGEDTWLVTDAAPFDPEGEPPW
jgi:hypothetical protein